MDNKKALADRIQETCSWSKFFFDKFPWLVQFVNFSLVGAINFFLSYFLYAGGLYIGFHHQLANQISFWLTVLNGYILNKYWVFQKKNSGRSRSEAIKYFSVYGFNFILGIGLLYLYVDVFGWDKYFAPIISMPITIPMNYLLNKKWVFSKRISTKENFNRAKQNIK